MPEKARPGQIDRIWAATSYLWALSVVVLLLNKKPFVHAHAKQGVLLFIGMCITFIPIIGWLFGWVASLISLVLAVVGIVKAWNGEKWEVPFIGKWWDKKVKI